MKYMITWRERPAASTREYEASQERILAIFKNWAFPRSFAIKEFVARVGELGGYMLVETDKPADIQYVTTVYAGFEFKVEPVIDVAAAVEAETKAIDYRKKNAA